MAAGQAAFFSLLVCRVPLVVAMDFETYHSLGLDQPFEEKPRTKHDSGMFNINGGMTRDQRWTQNFVAEAAAAHRYPLAPQATLRPGVPPGKYVEHKAWNSSTVYPGTERDWWYWVPAQYSGKNPANLLVFNDGGGFLNPAGQIRATLVLANMIAEGTLDVTIAVFLSPGIRPGHPDCAYDDAAAPGRATGDDPQRSLEYDTVSAKYSTFLLQDILPVIEAEYVLSQDPMRRALVGTSSGAVGAFCAAWSQPDKFGLVASISGSFVNIRGGHNLPWVIRNTPRKALKVFLLTGENDMDNNHGSWWLASQEMSASLDYAGYTQKLVVGTGGHGLTHAGNVFPSILLWLFKDKSVTFAEELGTWQRKRYWLALVGVATHVAALVLFWPVGRALRRWCAARLGRLKLS